MNELQPNKKFAPNKWGLYGMHGSVHEFVQDAWYDNYNGAPTDGSVWNPENVDDVHVKHVLRGGSWGSDAGGCRSASRFFSRSGVRGIYIGFRCARVQGDGEGVPSPGEVPQPSWASGWGRDGFGAWAEFAIKGEEGQRVTQRMRWIEPGTFLMGSPGTEAGRFSYEGPQHEVVFVSGYWMADTTVSRKMWNVVMGESQETDGSELPVNNITWHDAKRFIETLNERIQGLGLSLPSESQWEYACRAGTATPFSFGDNITAEQVNYDTNHPYQPNELIDATNPLASVNSESLSEILIALIPPSEGSNAIFSQKGMSLMRALMRVLVELRDRGEIQLSVRTIRNYISLNKVMELAERDDLILTNIQSLRAFMESVGWQKGKEIDKQPQSLAEQFSYAQSYINNSLNRGTAIFNSR